MKKTFDNAGVSTFQDELFQLSLSQRAAIISAVRSNFCQFLFDHFDFSSSQMTEIMTMTTDFATTTSEGIALTWESGQRVIFQKDTQPEGEHIKDRVVTNLNSPLVSRTSAWLPISIHIRYHLL